MDRHRAAARGAAEEEQRASARAVVVRVAIVGAIGLRVAVGWEGGTDVDDDEVFSRKLSASKLEIRGA